MGKWTECDKCKLVKSTTEDVTSFSFGVTSQLPAKPLISFDLCTSCANNVMVLMGVTPGKGTVRTMTDPKPRPGPVKNA